MIQLLFVIVVIVVLCAVAVWVLGQIAPGHPALIDNLIWVFCVIAVLLVLASAFGLTDIRVPRV